MSESSFGLTENPVPRGGMALILSGPSGSGKSTLYKKALAALGGFEFSVSCTTRAPREGERDGVDYHFITPEKFESLLRADAFAEHAEVHGNSYGTLKTELTGRMDRGIDVLLDIDVQGAMQLRKLCASDPRFAAACEFVFIMAPSYDELEKRLRGRGTESEESLAKRLRNARVEMASWDRYDYLVVNDDADAAAARLEALIAALRLSAKRIRKESIHV